MDTAPHTSEFQSRLDAIAATRGELSDQAEAMKEAARAERRAALIDDLMTPPMLMLCLLLGAGAMFLGRLAHFLHAGDQLEYQAITIEALIGIAALFMIRVALFVKERKYDVALGLGFVLMLTCMHNLVWMWPRLFAAIFSRDYVVAVENVTEPGTVFLWVVSIPFMAV
ncbi:MAG: hypothetical protein ABJ263_13160 [Tateyamaria sp.]|uniref:hypothetical protein n=1 Tax=Tateyamaria sp. TaxID=1929288 RepID=UPI00326A8680